MRAGAHSVAEISASSIVLKIEHREMQRRRALAAKAIDNELGIFVVLFEL